MNMEESDDVISAGIDFYSVTGDDMNGYLRMEISPLELAVERLATSPIIDNFLFIDLRELAPDTKIHKYHVIGL